ncbi:MAG: 50S ribosomal protein L33 [Planctomycetes bacterium]|nr:50S ribosomal protein L33 [Planctomycetota bacterium]
MREYVTLECGECGERNYRTQRQTRGGEGKLQLKKFCSRCGKHTGHKERKK